MVPVYAHQIDLMEAPWQLSLSAVQADSLIRRASNVIRNLTLTAIYVTDDDGLPTDPNVREVMRQATCAQVVWFDQLGDDGSGASGQFSTMSLGSARLSVGGGGSATNTTVTDSRYSPEAVQILANAGLISGQVRSW